MNNAMEMHDSFLLELRRDDDGQGYALFRAVIHRAEGAILDGDDHESGWQNLRLDFEGMRVEGEVDLAEQPYVTDGDLWLNGRNDPNLIYLPLDNAGEIRLEMRLSPKFDVVTVHATRIRSQLLGDFEFEHRWDAKGPVAS